MNERARRRAIRNFIASMLVSNLSKDDIVDIAEALLYGSFGKELGDALRQATKLLPNSSTERGAEVNDTRSSLANVAYEIIQRRKMSKKSVIDAIEASGAKLMKSRSARGTIKEILDLFSEVATPQQSSKFIRLIGEAAQDPYLKGIVGRD
jgi:hypothetical protein